MLLVMLLMILGVVGILLTNSKFPCRAWMHFTYGIMNERYVFYSENGCVNSWNCKEVIISLYDDVTNDSVINTGDIAQAVTC